MSDGQTLVIVGCGSAKRDRELEPGSLSVKRYPAKDLYTSTYFQKKREYAETVGDQWMILSALHGLLPPEEQIKPYDVSIGDLDGDGLDRLAHQVGMTVIEWVSWERGEVRPVDEIVVLAGRSYLDPIRERDAFQAGVDVPVSYPFQQNNLAGIGEQMGWLTERVAVESGEQKTLIADGGMRGPSTCPTCGHDPTGDDDEFVSGGGWVFDNEVMDGVFAELYRCPVCREVVHREEKSMGGIGEEVRGP